MLEWLYFPRTLRHIAYAGIAAMALFVFGKWLTRGAAA